MRDDETLNRIGAERIDDRQIAEIVGIAHGILADGVVNQSEAEYLQKWLEVRSHVTGNPVVRLLQERIGRHLADGILDVEEAADLLSTLRSFIGGDFERGEIVRSTTLPFCDPAPAMAFAGAPICFTGTFAFGPRKVCEDAASKVGSLPGPLNMSTRYLVVGVYATDGWSQSAFGRKIEKAASLRAKGHPIHIVGETHWTKEMTGPRS